MKHMIQEAAEQQDGAGEAAAAKPKKAAPIVEVVTLTDGRKVEFAGKKKLLKDYTLDPETGALQHIELLFRNGEFRKIVIPPQMIGQFAGHGAIQKYGDETAGEDDVDDMVLAIDELDSRIQKGEWGTTREGGGMSGTSVLLKALMEYGDRTVEQVKAFLANKTPKDKAALAANDKRPNAAGNTVKAIVDRIKAEKLAKESKVDTDAMLEGL
jgi:hypothetical protein